MSSTRHYTDRLNMSTVVSDITPITALPRNLYVGKTLWLSGTQITELPDDGIVGRCIW